MAKKEKIIKDLRKLLEKHDIGIYINEYTNLIKGFFSLEICANQGNDPIFSVKNYLDADKLKEME